MARKAPLALFVLLCLCGVASAQTTYSVPDETALRNAINSAAPGDSIVFTGNITLTGDLPSLHTDVTIDGQGFTLSGGNLYRGFVVAAYTVPTSGPPFPTSVSVTIQNITIANTVASGGAGGSGTSGGGGGAGMGGAIFVGSLANVTVSNVTFSANAANGGSGGNVVATAGGAGGGGGMGGAGGTSTTGTSSGGGGGFGVGANGGVESTGGVGTLIGAGSAGYGADGSLLGGANAGGAGAGGGSGSGGGGGGDSGLGVSGCEGGAGGFGGGGGGSACSFVPSFGGDGGFGGGGGGGSLGVFGIGGYGGGGGGNPTLSALLGGFFGGNGGTGTTSGGGGGAGLGGAIFVQCDSSGFCGTLQVSGPVNVVGGSVSGGAGGTGAQNGSAFGSGLYLMGSGTLGLTTAAGETQTIAGSIVDETGAGLSIGGSWGLFKDGAGTLVLSGTNLYSGGTEVGSGTLSVADGVNLGSGPVQLDGTSTLAITGSGTFNQNLFFSSTPSIASAPTISVGAGLSATWSGHVQNPLPLIDSFPPPPPTGLTVAGGGTLTLTDATNSYFGGTQVIGNSTVAIAADGALGDPTVGVTLGDATSTGTISFLPSSIFTTTRAFTLGQGGGIFNTGTGADIGISSVIDGSGSLTKSGAGTLTLFGTNTYTGNTFVTGGTLRAGISGAFNAGGAMTVGSGATLDLNSIGTTVASLSGAGTVSLGSATLTTNGDNTSTNFSGSIIGSGSLVKVGTGTLFLTGVNSYTGGTTVSSGGLAGTTSSLQGNILNNGFVQFSQDSSGTYGGSMTGNGSLFVSGLGTITLSGANSFAGGTTITGGGAISVAADTALGTGGVTLGDASSSGGVTFTNSGAYTASRPFTIQSGGGIFNTIGSSPVTLNGTISGVGSLFKTGAGTLILGGTNSYGGGTSITGGGAVSVASDGAFGAAAGAVTLGNATSTGTVTFTNSSAYTSSRLFLLGSGGGIFNTTATPAVTLNGPVTGSGSLTKTGTGTLVLGGQASYTGGTFVNAGTLRTSASNLFGASSVLTIGSGAAFDIGNSSQTLGAITGTGSLLLSGGILTTGANGANSVFDGAISGNGSLVKTGSGVLTLTGANSYTGGTSVLSGVLAGTTTSIQGNIQNNATVLFDQNFNGTYGGAMGGSGALQKDGSGILTLSGNNTYTGGTFINGGSVIGTASSLQGTIVNNSSLTFGGPADGSFSGILSGKGSLFKIGTGTLTLNGTQPISGTLNVNQGTLALNGIFGGTVNVAPGATLQANGLILGSLNLGGSLFAIPTTTIAADAIRNLPLGGGQAITVNPYLTVGGDLTGTDGSLMNFSIGPGTTPTIAVGGVASLNGTHLDITAPSIGSSRSTSFLAITTGSALALQNATVTTPDPNVIPLLKQDRNSLFVTLVNLNIPLAGVVSGGNAGAVADAIDRTKFGATGDRAFVIRELTALGDQELGNALEQIAGQIHATVLQTGIMDSEAITDLVRGELQSRDEGDQDPLHIWSEFACQHATFDRTSSARGGTGNVCGAVGGVDRRLSDHWRLGGGGSYSGGNLGLNAFGSGDYSAPRAFGYVGFQPRSFGFAAGGSAAHQNYTTTRQIVFQATLPDVLGGDPLTDGVDRQAQSDQNGTQTDSWSEYHDSFKAHGFTYEYLVGIRRARFSRGGWTETGADSLSLQGPDQVFTITQTDVKMHAYRRTGDFRPFFDMLYRRELTDGTTTADLSFANLPQSGFTVEGLGVPGNTVAGKFGAVWKLRLGQATFTYEFKHAPGQIRQTASLKFRFK